MQAWVRKWWWLAVIILAISLVIGWEEKRCQAEAYECRAKYATELSGVETNQKATEQQAIAAACEPNSYFCRLFSAANLPTVLLVFIGIGGVWAALRTLGSIDKQVRAMIDSERAWIMVEIVPVPGQGERIHARTVGDTTIVSIKIKFRNEGKVPAWITERHAYVSIVDAIPENPNFRINGKSNCEPEPVGPGKDACDWDATPDCAGREREGQSTIVYGIVRYRDAFSQGHTSTFGHLLQEGRGARRIEKYPKYNENT